MHCLFRQLVSYNTKLYIYIVRYIFDFTIVQPFIEYRYYNL